MGSPCDPRPLRKCQIYAPGAPPGRLIQSQNSTLRVTLCNKTSHIEGRDSPKSPSRAPPSGFPPAPSRPPGARVFPQPLVECKIFRSTSRLISVLDIPAPGLHPDASSRKHSPALRGGVGGFMAELRRRTDMIDPGSPPAATAGVGASAPCSSPPCWAWAWGSLPRRSRAPGPGARCASGSRPSARTSATRSDHLEERSRPLRHAVRDRAEELRRRGRKKYEEAWRSSRTSRTRPKRRTRAPVCWPPC